MDRKKRKQYAVLAIDPCNLDSASLPTQNGIKSVIKNRPVNLFSASTRRVGINKRKKPQTATSFSVNAYVVLQDLNIPLRNSYRFLPLTYETPYLQDNKNDLG